MPGQVPEFRILKFGFNPITDIEIRSILGQVGVDVLDNRIDLHENWTSMEFLRSTSGGEIFETSSAWYVAGRIASLVGANAILVGLEHPSAQDVEEFSEGFGDGELIGLFVTEHDGQSDPSDIIRVPVD